MNYFTEFILEFKMSTLTKIFKRVIPIVLLIASLWLITGCGKKKVSPHPNRLKPGSAEFYLNEGVFYLNSGNLKMAEEKLNKALRKKPNMVAAINSMGILYLQKQQFDRAAQYFRQVIKLNPKYVDAYNYLGVIFSETGKYQLAKENLLVAANSESYRTPENAFANLALLEIKEKKYNSAMRYVEKGIKENKNFAPLYNLKGIILENANQYQQAIHFYEKALSMLTEDDISYLINVGRVYAKMGQKNKALDVLEKALAKTTIPIYKKQINAMLEELQKK